MIVGIRIYTFKDGEMVLWSNSEKTYNTLNVNENHQMNKLSLLIWVSELFEGRRTIIPLVLSEGTFMGKCWGNNIISD